MAEHKLAVAYRIAARMGLASGASGLITLRPAGADSVLTASSPIFWKMASANKIGAFPLATPRESVPHPLFPLHAAIHAKLGNADQCCIAHTLNSVVGSEGVVVEAGSTETGWEMGVNVDKVLEAITTNPTVICIPGWGVVSVGRSPSETVSQLQPFPKGVSPEIQARLRAAEWKELCEEDSMMEANPPHSYNDPVNASPSKVLEFWFGNDPNKLNYELWFMSTPEVDREISRRFGAMVMEAMGGGYGEWERTYGAKGLLARVILLDQFPRNLFRKQVAAFSGDKLACSLCKSAIESGLDKELGLMERSFLYLPLEHSESRADQDLSIKMFEQLFADAKDGPLEGAMASALKFANDHAKVVYEFGRYPHRNEALGRETTEEEKRSLAQGETWGQ